MGLVQRVDLGDGGSRYEPILPGGEHHHHAVCDTCGKVTPFEDERLEGAPRAACGTPRALDQRPRRRHPRRLPALRSGHVTLRRAGPHRPARRSTALEDVSLEIPAGVRSRCSGPTAPARRTLFRAADRARQAGVGVDRSGWIKVAFVPQRLDIEPSFPVTVTDVVRMGRYGELGWLGRFGDRDRELVEGAIAALEISHLADRRFGDLSGGERQRALLAQAAAQDAEILLLDEPFTGLDAPTRAHPARPARPAGATDGRTVVVATHDLRERQPRLRPRPLPQPPAGRLRPPGRDLHRGGPRRDVRRPDRARRRAAGRHRAPPPRSRRRWTS